MNAITFVVVVAVGAIVLLLVTLGLRALGGDGWLASLPWIVATGGALAWALWRPDPADRHDDDQGWIDYTIRRVLLGEERLRPRPLRAVATVVFGGPVATMFVLGLIAELSGIV